MKCVVAGILIVIKPDLTILELSLSLLGVYSVRLPFPDLYYAQTKFNNDLAKSVTACHTFSLLSPFVTKPDF